MTWFEEALETLKEIETRTRMQKSLPVKTRTVDSQKVMAKSKGCMQ